MLEGDNGFLGAALCVVGLECGRPPAGHGLHFRCFLLHAVAGAVRCAHLFRHLARE